MKRYKGVWPETELICTDSARIVAPAAPPPPFSTADVPPPPPPEDNPKKKRERMKFQKQDIEVAQQNVR